jgi:hypothetical protein
MATYCQLAGYPISNPASRLQRSCIWLPPAHGVQLEDHVVAHTTDTIVGQRTHFSGLQVVGGPALLDNSVAQPGAITQLAEPAQLRFCGFDLRERAGRDAAIPGSGPFGL